MSNGFVCVMGIGTVFFGLICLIVITMIVSTVCKSFVKPQAENNAVKTAPSNTAAPAAIENKQEIIAGVCAVIAEELGTDVNNIKVTSFKRL